MIKKDKISIITPLCNSEKYIAKTIESVLNQNYDNWEMIIVDDFSTDCSTNIVKKYSNNDPRIKLIKLQNNSGAAVARNIAIENSSGKYIAFLDSDDVWLPQKLEKQINFMQKNNYLFTFSYYGKIDEDDTSLNKIIKAPDVLNYKKLLTDCKIGCLTAIYDSENLGKIYMPLIRKRQDYGLWLKILKKGIKAYCYPELLAYHRIRTNSISSNKLNLVKYNWTLFREIEDLSFFRSTYYLSWNIINKLLK